jgi:hypothetical protein
MAKTRLIEEVKVQSTVDQALINHVALVLDGSGSMSGLEVKLKPEATPDFDIFIQSTSVNRNLLPGQKVVVLS